MGKPRCISLYLVLAVHCARSYEIRISEAVKGPMPGCFNHFASKSWIFSNLTWLCSFMSLRPPLVQHKSILYIFRAYISIIHDFYRWFWWFLRCWFIKDFPANLDFARFWSVDDLKASAFELWCVSKNRKWEKSVWYIFQDMCLVACDQRTASNSSWKQTNWPGGKKGPFFSPDLKELGEGPLKFYK